MMDDFVGIRYPESVENLEQESARSRHLINHEIFSSMVNK